MLLSKYKNILGKPQTGIHRFRIWGTNTALVDYLLTLFLAWIITFLTGIPLVITTILAFSIGIFVHILFGVETQVVQLIM